MKPNSLENQLESLDKVEISTPLHQRRLKSGLLASAEKKSFFSLMNFSKLVPAGMALAVVTAVVLNSGSFNFAPRASAQELLNQAIEKLQDLKPEDLASIQESLGLSSTDDVVKALNEAKAAKDLAYVDREDVSCEKAAELKKQGLPTAEAFSVTFHATTDGTGALAISDDQKVTEFTDGMASDTVASEGDLNVNGFGNCKSAYVLHTLPDAKYPEGFSEVHIIAGDYKEPELKFVQYTNPQGEHVFLGLAQDLKPLYTANTAKAEFTQILDDKQLKAAVEEAMKADQDEEKDQKHDQKGEKEHEEDKHDKDEHDKDEHDKDEHDDHESSGLTIQFSGVSHSGGDEDENEATIYAIGGAASEKDEGSEEESHEDREGHEESDDHEDDTEKDEHDDKTQTTVNAAAGAQTQTVEDTSDEDGEDAKEDKDEQEDKDEVLSTSGTSHSTEQTEQEESNEQETESEKD